MTLSPRSCSALLAFVVFPVFLAGLPSRVEVRSSTPPTLIESNCPNVQGAIFCADGAGGFGGTTAALRQAVTECLPLCVHEVDWTVRRR